MRILTLTPRSHRNATIRWTRVGLCMEVAAFGVNAAVLAARAWNASIRKTLYGGAPLSV